MAEMYKLKFPVGRQTNFLKNAQIKLQASNQTMADLCGISVRTWTDWRRERFLLPEIAAQKISRTTNIAIPNAKRVNEFWYTKIGAELGGRATYAIYGKVPGAEEYRKKRWEEWWEREGQFKDSNLRLIQPQKIHYPNKSIELAEFIGIMMGDGGITQYQTIVTLHSIDDKEYSIFVQELIKKLFEVPVSIRKIQSCNAVNLRASSTELVKFCHQLGLPIGNKIRQKLDIPKWIMANLEYQKACLRGLVDTDGSIFTHRYKVANKWYAYKKLDFCSASPYLIKSTVKIFQNIGIKARISRGKNIRIDSVEGMAQYFNQVSSHNPKHLKRYKN